MASIAAAVLRTLTRDETIKVLSRHDEPTVRLTAPVAPGTPARKTVLVDMDGVLADSLPNWLAAYNLFSGEDIEVEDIKSYGFGQHVRQPELLFSCLERAMVFLNAKPMPGAVEGFRKLCKAHDVYVVTYNHESCPSGFQQKLAWMRRHFPEFPSNRVIFTKNKGMVQGDVIIEDSPDNIQAWLSVNPKGRAFCIAQPYNDNLQPTGVRRVSSINEVTL